ncbi:MAG: zinc-dependent peptidase [Oscillatoria sp. PMC 1051.18]|nr:zinc-dependent peptidase [Oscillatoria sp. PMC 1051.18]
MQTLLVLLIISVIIALILLNPFLIKQRRQRIRNKLLSPLENAIIANSLPIYDRLNSDERRRLQGHIQVFLAEKQFIGCGGLQITTEIKLAIAATACLLLLNEREKYFPSLRTIIIYPTAYIVKQNTAISNYVVAESEVVRLGESWTKDQLVLSWEQVQRDTKNWRDGHNVILHEFAHQLDQEKGNANGVPLLKKKADYHTWTQVMTREYQQLCFDVEKGRKTVMNSYGATAPAEFFAVATETFFEKPKQLLQKHPQLYQILQNYYQLDPLQWSQQLPSP